MALTRSNIGNSITNASQTGSVSVTTMSGIIQHSRDRADRALLNKKMEQQRDERFAQQSELNSARIEKTRLQNEGLKQKQEQLDEQQKYRSKLEKEKLKKAKLQTQGQELINQARQAKLDKSIKTVDDIMSGLGTEQADYLGPSIKNNLEYLERRANMLEFMELGYTEGEEK